jgi:hypothetical protein
VLFYLWEYNVRYKNVHNKIFTNKANYYQLKAVHATGKYTPVNKHVYYKTSLKYYFKDIFGRGGGEVWVGEWQYGKTI